VKPQIRPLGDPAEQSFTDKHQGMTGIVIIAANFAFPATSIHRLLKL
jgi:hypothetical protein